MKDTHPVAPALAWLRPETASEPKGAIMPVQFDTDTSLAEMRKFQDPAKFDKARFRFRLYKR